MGIIPQPSESQVSGPAGRVMGAGGAGPSPVKCVWSPIWESGPQKPRFTPRDHALPPLLPAEATHVHHPPHLAADPPTGAPGEKEAGRLQEACSAREASPSHPLLGCLWPSPSASLNVSLSIYKMGLKMFRGFALRVG